MSNPFDRNPFRLPPPWNAAYALPQNVDDEGLERHAYTTAWAPRGSFDDPKVGTADYVLPEYIKEEGYGVGAFATRWAPRGTYYGPKVKHWLDVKTAKIVGADRLPGGAAKLKLQVLDGLEQAMGNERAPLHAYGLDVATALIDTVKMMPPDVRKRQLKMALDKIDPKLYRQAEIDADKEVKLGVPAAVALQRGLGVAVSYGLANELVAVAARGDKMVPKKSQLGNAAYYLGLGEEPTRAGFCWIKQYVRASDGVTVPGHWERQRAGVPCAEAPPEGNYPAPTVRVCTSTDQSGCPGGVFVANTATPTVQVKTTVQPAPISPTAPADQIFVQIGPFMIPVTAGAYRDHRTLTDEKKAFIDENIAIAAKAGGISIAEMKSGKYPFVKFKVKEGTEAWGLYYQEKSDGGTIVAYHKLPADQGLSGLGNVREALGFGISDIGSAIKDVASAVGGAIWSVLKKIWAGIKWVAVKVANFVVDAAKWVAKMTCKITTTPGVAETAQAVATAAPNPYTVAIAAGITVTKMICDHYADKPGASAEEKAAAEAAAAAAAALAAEEEAKKKKQQTFILLGGAAAVAGLLIFTGGKKKH